MEPRMKKLVEKLKAWEREPVSGADFVAIWSGCVVLGIAIVAIYMVLMP